MTERTGSRKFWAIRIVTVVHDGTVREPGANGQPYDDRVS